MYARLKVQEKQIYLEVYIKYWNLREVTTKDTDRTKTLKDKYRQDKVMLSAMEEDKEVRYYNSKQLLGTFYKDKLTDRSQNAKIHFGVNTQDLWVKSEDNLYKLYKNFRGLLSYLNEEEYKKSVKFLKNRNREIKLEGQSNDKNNEDPRYWFNDQEETEMEKDNRQRINEGEEIEREEQRKMEKIKQA